MSLSHRIVDAAVAAAQAVPRDVAQPPFLDLYPVAKIRNTRQAALTPLGRRVVSAQPAAPGIRGKRYVLELAGPSQEVATLDRAIDFLAPEQRVFMVRQRARQQREQRRRRQD